MIGARLALAAALLVVACAACPSREPTQLVVVVTTDFAVPSQLDRVEIVARRGGFDASTDAPLQTGSIALGPDGAVPPEGLTLGVLAGQGYAGPVHIEVTAFLQGDAVVARTVDTAFVAHETRVVGVRLSRRCAGIQCPAGTACREAPRACPSDAPGACAAQWFCDDPSLGADELPRPPVCPPGYASCGVPGSAACETDLGGSSDHCGACAQSRCASGGCVGGLCQDHRFVQLVAGARHTCGRRQNGQVVCWGDNSVGQVTGTPSPGALPAQPLAPSIDDATDLAAGEAFTCAVRSSGAITCWGANDFAQLGTGSVNPGVHRGEAILPPGAGAFQGVGAGRYHACARVMAQLPTTPPYYTRVVCWGRNDNHQAVPSDNADVVPTPERFGDFTNPGDLAGGDDFSCVRTDRVGTTHGVYCWGRDAFHQLGGTPSSPSTWAMVPGARQLDQLAAGAHHACATSMMESAVYCWGDDSRAQLGGTADPTGATRVPLPSPPIAISAAGATTCAVLGDHSLYCWGDNAAGAQGDGTTALHRTPTANPILVGALAVVTLGGGAGSYVAAGDAGTPPQPATHGCASHAFGSVFCWGDDSAGQLGFDAPAGGAVVLAPTPVPNLP